MAFTRRKRFLNWVDRNPKCKFIDDEAYQSEVLYDPNNEDPSQRIKIFHTPNLEKKPSIIKKIIQSIWVPGTNLRGKSWSSNNFDAQLGQTASIMSFSGIFDGLCIAPVLWYLTKAAGFFAIPTSILYSALLLIISNKAGEYSMNRPKDNNSTASFLLFVFFVLSLLKTLMSGVGLDLVSRSGEIKNATASQFLEIKAPLTQKKEIIYSDLLDSASKECNKLTAKQSQLDLSNRSQRKIYNELQAKMYRKPLNIESQDPKYLLDNFSMDLGPCRKVNLINNLNGQNNFNQENSLKYKYDLSKILSPVSSLYVFQRNKYNDIFNGNPLKGSRKDLEKYIPYFEKSNIDFNINCINSKENCLEDVSWSNPGQAINEASKQFYSRLGNKDWSNLGLSYIGFLISILLSTSSTVLLYTASIDIRNRASRSSKVEEWMEDIFAELDTEEEAK